jgi:hypothetical protein
MVIRTLGCSARTRQAGANADQFVAFGACFESAKAAVTAGTVPRIGPWAANGGERRVSLLFSNTKPIACYDGAV